MGPASIDRLRHSDTKVNAAFGMFAELGQLRANRFETSVDFVPCLF